MKIFWLSLLAKPHEKAVHLHALETLKVVIGVTTPAQANGCVDQEKSKYFHKIMKAIDWYTMDEYTNYYFLIKHNNWL
jgi:hypothetical protein